MRFFLVIFFTALLNLTLSASHFVGGEITWECDKDPASPNFGRYTFYLTIYGFNHSRFWLVFLANDRLFGAFVSYGKIRLETYP